MAKMLARKADLTRTEARPRRPFCLARLTGIQAVVKCRNFLDPLAPLSVNSGIAKIMPMPPEVNIFGDAGFNETSLILFGIAQLAGGVLLIIRRMRVSGAVIVAVTFVASTVLIFMDARFAVAKFSLLPADMAILVIKTSPARA